MNNDAPSLAVFARIRAAKARAESAKVRKESAATKVPAKAKPGAGTGSKPGKSHGGNPNHGADGKFASGGGSGGAKGNGKGEKAPATAKPKAEKVPKTVKPTTPKTPNAVKPPKSTTSIADHHTAAMELHGRAGKGQAQYHEIDAHYANLHKSINTAQANELHQLRYGTPGKGKKASIDRMHADSTASLKTIDRTASIMPHEGSTPRVAGPKVAKPAVSPEKAAARQAKVDKAHEAHTARKAANEAKASAKVKAESDAAAKMDPMAQAHVAIKQASTAAVRRDAGNGATTHDAIDRYHDSLGKNLDASKANELHRRIYGTTGKSKKASLDRLRADAHDALKTHGRTSFSAAKFADDPSSDVLARVDAARAKADHAAALAYLASIARPLGLVDSYLDGSISEADRRVLLHAVGKQASDELGIEAESLRAALAPVPFSDLATFGVRDKIGKFFGKALNIIKRASLAAALVLMGPAELNVEERQIHAAQVVKQEAYIRNFQQDIVSGTQPPDGTLPARAEQYGAATWLTAQNTVAGLASAPDSPVTEEQWVLGVADHCRKCPELALLSWVEIDTLPEIGSTPCRIFCRCHKIYRDASGVPWTPIARP